MNSNYMISNYIDFNCSASPKGPKLIHVSSQHDSLDHDLKMTDPVRLHSHKFTEIMLVTQGSATFLYNTKHCNVNKGDMIIVNPGILHLETWTDEFTFYTIGVLDLIIPENNQQFVYSTGIHLDTYRFYFHTLMDEVRNKSRDYKKIMKNAFENICILLRRDIVKIEQGAKANTEKPTQNAALLAKEFIEANYLQDITLDILCQIAYLSPQHLIRQFKALTGYPPHKYLSRVRIKVAAANLLQRDNTIRQIGELSGFNDPHTFILSFKKMIGMTPQQFREKYELNPAEGMRLANFTALKSDKYLIDSFKE